MAKLPDTPEPSDGTVVYTMTIRLKNGRVIRRPCGRPFRIVVRSRKVK